MHVGGVFVAYVAADIFVANADVKVDIDRADAEELNVAVARSVAFEQQCGNFQ